MITTNDALSDTVFTHISYSSSWPCFPIYIRTSVFYLILLQYHGHDYCYKTLTLPCWFRKGWLSSEERTLNLSCISNHFLSWRLESQDTDACLSSSLSHQLPFSSGTFYLAVSALQSLPIIEIISFTDAVSSSKSWQPTLLASSGATSFSLPCTHMKNKPFHYLVYYPHLLKYIRT